jgi:hypothetical protein
MATQLLDSASSWRELLLQAQQVRQEPLSLPPSLLRPS